MTIDVDTVGQTADDKNVRPQAAEFIGKALAHVFSVLCACSGAYDAEAIGAVEVGGAFVVEYQRSVVTAEQALRIILRTIAEALYVMVSGEVPFLSGVLQGLLSLGKEMADDGRGELGRQKLLELLGIGVEEG